MSSFNRTNKRKAIATSKFYFFDLGVVRALLNKRNIISKTDADFGLFFESFIFQELNAYSSYNRIKDVQYWRSKSNFEVDFIFNDQYAIEVKSTSRVTNEDLNGLKVLSEEKMLKSYYLVSFDKKEQQWQNINCMYWENFLKLLYSGKLLN